MSRLTTSNTGNTISSLFWHGQSLVMKETENCWKSEGGLGRLLCGTGTEWSAENSPNARSDFPRRTDGFVAQNTVLSSCAGFSFPKQSALSEEHKNPDTSISAETQQQHQQHFASCTVTRKNKLKNTSQQGQLPTTSSFPSIVNEITSEPTLLPSVTLADSAFHDSNCSEVTFGDLHPRPAPNLTFQSAQSSSLICENLTIEAGNNHSMGCNSTTEVSAWRELPDVLREQKTEAHMTQGTHDETDSATVRSADTGSIGSPSHGPLQSPPVTEQNSVAVSGAQSTVTTPSTVSTAPSTNDEGSFAPLDPAALERFALRSENNEPSANQRRGLSLENPSYQSHLYVQDENDNGTFSGASNSIPSLPPTQAQTLNAPNAWINSQGLQRVATFRNDYGLPHNAHVAPNEARWHQQQQQQQIQATRYENSNTSSFAQFASRSAPSQSTSYSSYQRTQLPPATPPRTGRSQRGPTNANPHRQSPSASTVNLPNQTQVLGSSSGNPRSPSEVLKTLLRKKACLYEPDTSRAVALVTWLVGRVLALEHGYFSRQQLQAGVHACVASKIDAGVITRTKVNRCMQIILNSCFHYIIPRPDGTEENGDSFRFLFANEVADDIRLLYDLPAPWNDLTVERVVVLEATEADIEGKQGKSLGGSNLTTPQSSPKLGSTPSEKLSPRSKEDLDGDSKRAVLLCFNENVRCAEDVFRCHNEFIRDTAHASGLQLSSSEWRSFFGKEAAGAPHLWGNVGIPVPHSDTSNQTDALGVMTRNELAKFRTTWCSKRYDHDHELCGFAHVEINSGWLRRNPEQHEYSAEMCPDVVQFTSRSQMNRRFVINGCARGDKCQFAHSPEEIIYHPKRYKTGLCPNLARLGGCSRADVCSDFHPMESYKFPSKKGEGRPNFRQGRQGGNNPKSSHVPTGAPVLYCSPAPISRFEEQFLLPGLKNLYRRHCSVMRAYLRNPGSCVCCYSCFGDDNGAGHYPSQPKSTTFRGLPQPCGV